MTDPSPPPGNPPPPSGLAGTQTRLEALTRPRGEEGELRVEGVVKRLYFVNEENGWAAILLEPDDGTLAVHAKGAMPGVSVGDPVRLRGRLVQDPKWGPQLQVTAYEPRVPTGEEGIRRYLGSGLVEGIGSALASRLVDAFGSATLEVIDRQPERLTEVEGIGPKRAKAIREALEKQRDIKQVMVFLQGHGLSPSKAQAVHRRYGAEAVTQLRQNPFRLADDVFGIGFATADRMAESLGIGPEAPFRIQAGITYALDRAAEEGHLYLPEEELLARATALLGIDEALVAEGIPRAVEDGRVRAQTVTGPTGEPLRACYPPALLGAEVELAARLRGLAEARVPALALAPNARAQAERRLGISLSADQARAVDLALGAKVAVITGGPGTGKTTILRVLLELTERAGLTAELAAPTGRAAKRMQEATSRPARTLHRLLEYIPRAGGFQRTPDRPLACDLLVVDEVSMLDAPLARALVRALPPTARLLLVGDADQLPSVGPGAVLEQIIASGVVPVQRLTEVYRQAAKSQIVLWAHQVNQGVIPSTTPSAQPGSAPGEVFLVEVDDPLRAAELVVKLVCERIPARYGLDPVADIQVLGPTRKGQTGVERLNVLLQEALNPGGEVVSRRGAGLRVGDKVMQIRNDYDKEVWNGDLGRVAGLGSGDPEHPEQRRLQVSFEGRLVEYGPDELEPLVLSYACTVHKSQGSEFPAVVLPLLHEHYLMLERNLLYTAITRARRLAVLVGSRRALRRAVTNDQVRLRYTALAERLRRPG